MGINTENITRSIKTALYDKSWRLKSPQHKAWYLYIIQLIESGRIIVVEAPELLPDSDSYARAIEAIEPPAEG
jgi:hypothetical protein